MTKKEYKNLLRMDLARWKGKHTFLFLRHKEYRLVYRYRRCKYLEESKNFILYFLERFIYNKLCQKCGCDIPSHVKIAGGMKIVHSWGIVINSKAIIGENFTIKSGCVIGEGRTGVPTIGDNVICNVHSVIFGGISIGNGAEIGAGAVVTHNVPNDGVVIGDSAHLLKIR